MVAGELGGHKPQAAGVWHNPHGKVSRVATTKAQTGRAGGAANANMTRGQREGEATNGRMQRNQETSEERRGESGPIVQLKTGAAIDGGSSS